VDVPKFRADLLSIPRYVPGKPIDEVARDLGLARIDKLASNESPDAPFPAVAETIATAATQVNRYPDSDSYHLTRAIASFYGVEPAEVWIGAGSSDLLRAISLATSGPDTSSVFAWPSFVMYRICARLTGSEGIEVSLTDDRQHDLEAMLAAIRDDTTIVYVCNPNNPTGGHLGGDEVRRFVDAVPSDVLVVVDEAYAEYVTADDYRSMIPETTERPNVITLRTFSKVYGLAGLRVGYAIGDADLLAALKRTQSPFAVTSVAQAAAIESLNHQDGVRERAVVNAYGRAAIVNALVDRGFEPAPTQANFVYFEPDTTAKELADALLGEGIIVRALGDGIRVTVGTDEENGRFIAALDAVTGS
jgi:histidinol-phosphate aminotransferase